MDVSRVVATVATLVVPTIDNGFAQAVAKDMSKAVDGATNAISGKLGSTASRMGKSLAVGVNSPVVEAFAGVGDQIVKEAQGAGEGLAKGIGGPVEDAFKGLEDNAKGLGEKVREEVEKPLRRSFGDMTKSLKNGLSKTAKRMTIGVTTPLVGAGVAIIKLAEQTDDAKDKIRAATGLTGAALESLQKSFMVVNKKTVQDIGDVADVFSTIAARTKFTGPAIETVTEQVLYLQEVTGQTVSGDALGQLFQAWQMDGPAAAKSLDVLFRASQYSGESVDNLTASMQTLRPAFAQIGYSFDQGAGLVASFAKAGIDADSTLAFLGKAATKAAKNGVPFQKVFSSTLTEIDRYIKLGNDTKALDLATSLFGKNGATKAIVAFKNGALDINGAVTQVTNGSDTLTKAVGDTRDFSQQLTLFKKSMNQSLGELGEKLFPMISEALGKLIPKVERLVDKFQKLSPTSKKIILIGLGLAAAIGPVAGVFVKVIGAVEGVISIGKKLKTAFTAIQGAWSALSGGLAAVNWPLVLGIAAVVVIAILIIKNWDKIKAGFLVVVDAIKRAWSATVSFLGNMVAGVVSFIRDHWRLIISIIGGPIGIAVALVTKYWGNITAVFGATVDFVKDVFSKVGTLIGLAVDGYVAYVKFVWGGVKDILTTPFYLAKDIISGVIDAIVAMFSVLKDAAAKALGPVKKVVDLGIKSGKFVGKVGGSIFNAVIPGRAIGGPVQSGRPYIVGERGPELMVPRTSGSVIPNNALAGSLSGSSYNINVYNPVAEPASVTIPRALRRAGALRG